MPVKKDQTDILSLAENNLQRTTQWVSIIDSKALFMLTIILAILSYIFTKFDEFISLVFYLYGNKETALEIVIILLMTIQLIGFITSGVYLILIIYPKRVPYTQEISSLFFYETISKMSIINFNRDISSITLSKAIEGINDQTYNVAKVITKKFDQLAISIRWFSLGLTVFLIYLIIQSLLTGIYM